MSHLVETMAYVGETPWHGLGVNLPENQSIDQWRVAAGMDWEIQEAPALYYPAGGVISSVADKKVLYRSDTNQSLAVVGSRFNPVGPAEVLEFFRDLTEKSGYKIETAGVLKEGRKLWALARTGDSLTLKGNDRTDGYVLLATACDGTLATTAQFTSVRVVCANTLAVSLGEGRANAVKISHRSVFDADEVKKQMGITVSNWDNYLYTMRTLSERKVSEKEAMDYIAKLYPSAKGDVSTRLDNKRKNIYALFNGNGMGAQFESSRGTAYGLLNAVTQFVDHDNGARNRDNRLNSAWFGNGAKLKDHALNKAIALAA